jgi:methyl-accepting chemotaxis protein
MIPQKRKNYFIEKRFQAKYMILTVLILLAYSFLFVSVIFAPYILKLYLNYPVDERAEAAQVLLLLDAKMWPWIGAVILFFGIISIYVSHMVAGPLFHLKKSLSRVTQGDLEEVIRLRKWDDLKDVAKHVNELTGELRGFVTALKNDYDLLSDYIADLEYKIEKKMLSEEAGKEIIGKIQESRKNIEIALKKFNIQA